jgi:hypothetical protein
MQWFVEWRDSLTAVDGDFLIPVANWRSVRQVTTANQPGLPGESLYTYGSPGPSNDPQTSDELNDMAARIAATGVRAYGRLTQQQAYHQYLHFLRSSVVQLSSNLIHDYFNLNGLTVTSNAHLEPFTIFGDGNLLKDDFKAISAVTGAVAASQSVIPGIIKNGYASYKPQDIVDMLPSQVSDSNSGRILPLSSWNTILETQAKKLFGGVQGLVKSHITAAISPTMGVVSRDELPASPGGTELRGAALTANASLKQAWTYPFIENTSAVTPFWNGERLYAGLARSIYEFQPTLGVLLQNRALPPEGDQVAGDVTFASDGKTLYTGTAGMINAVSEDDFSVIHWRMGIGGSASVTVTYTDDGSLFAACATAGVYRLSRETGSSLDYNNMLGGGWGTNVIRLAVVEKIVVVGMTERLIAFDRTNLSGGGLWSVDPMDDSTHIVDILALGGAVMASNGAQYRLLDPAGGGNGQARFLAQGFDQLTGEVRQATDGVNVYRGGAGQLISYSLTGLYNVAGGPSVPALNWKVALTTDGSALVNVLAVEAGIFASANGSVYHVNPADGTFYSVTQLAGTGSSDIQMASDGVSLFCGVSNGITTSKLVALTLNTDS